MIYILFIIWFIFLIKGADIMVEGSSSVAKRFWISPIIIGLTIVAFWTSAPELVVNILSSFNWYNELALWNILWSNISNVLLMLWVFAIIAPLVVKKRTVFIEIPMAVLASVVILVLVQDKILSWTLNQVSRWDWIILLLFFLVFIFYTFRTAKSWKNDTEKIHLMSLSRSIIYIFLWFVWLIFWWKWIVDWAVEIAKMLWMTEATIWLTIVAI